MSRQTLHAILSAAQPVTPLMALHRGKLCGNGPELQTRRDLQKLRREWRAEIAAIATLPAA